MASLLATTGPASGTRFSLPDEPIISVGRDDQCTVQVLDPAMSRKHLQILRDEHSGMRTAADYRSANGVQINGRRIVRDTRLEEGDEIMIGDSTLVFSERDDSGPDAAIDPTRRRDEWKRSTLAGD